MKKATISYKNHHKIDLVCRERLDPDPVCPRRLDLDPDPVNIRPDPQP